MALQNGAQVRTRIDPALASPIQIVIGIWGDQEEEIPFELKRLSIEQQVAAEFRGAGHAHLNDIAGSHLLPFQPEYTPDPHGEPVVLQLNRNDFDYPDLLDAILNPGGLPPFILGRDKNVAFHCFVVRRGNVDAGFLKAAGGVLLPRKGIWGFLVENRVARLDTQVLTFSPDVDILMEPNFLWISRVGVHRSLFRGSEALLQAVETNVAAVSAVLPIANADAFETACRSDPRMMARLARVAAKPYLQSLTRAAVAQVVADYNLPPDVLDGQGRLIHDNHPDHRWLILKILDDSYQRSTLTNIRYEVNSKLQI